MKPTPNPTPIADRPIVGDPVHSATTLVLLGIVALTAFGVIGIVLGAGYRGRRS